ncbi:MULTISPECIES: GyrI-like domain-containing protein [unclassified Bradyrhizobium]|uniref:GyrI-like domain-containing protein n=1 Tax=unclassified Bradyrhizobium TaxID=2631580 RepID=UPI0028E5EDDC|nr:MULTISPECIES: GyrI-like domain-containing protein [unclassified Bradyrhizobium]
MNLSTFRLVLAVSSVALLLGGTFARAQAPSASPAPAASATPAPAPSALPAPVAPASPAPAASASPAPATSPTPAASASPSPSSSPTAAQSPATTPPQAAAPAQAADAFGDEIKLEAKKVVLVKGTANWDNAFDTLIDSFKSLSATLDKQGIKPAGNGMIVYTSTDDTGFTFLAEMPVEQEPKTLGKGMSIGQSPEGKALKFVHRGSYDNMDNTYEAITNHLDERRLEAKDTFIEEYLTDPLKTAEDKLVINVYVPLK